MKPNTRAISKTVFMLAASAAMALLVSCGQQKPDTRATLQITSSPEGAVVNIRGEELGATPFKCKLASGTYIVKLSKLNYNSSWERVSLQPSSTKMLEVSLQPVCASIMLTSVPLGAKVEFDGREIGETPLTIHDLKVGSYSAILKKLGYVQREVSWKIENGRPQLVQVEMSSNIGSLKIESGPSGASVFIDGEPRGNTPFSDKLEQGQHKVRIAKEGYAVFEQLATVTRDRTSSVSATLGVLPGSLKVISSPQGASVFVNNRQYQNTPVELKGLDPGVYSVRLEKNGYDPAVREVTIAPGQAIEVDLNLDSNTGGIDLVANPPGITIYLDGKLVGTTMPDTGSPGSSKVFSLRNLSMGRHTVTVAHKLAIPDKKTITVNIRKGAVERLPIINFWIANATLKLKSGQIYTGRLLSETDTIVIFEPEPGIRQSYKRGEISSLKPLKDKE